MALADRIEENDALRARNNFLETAILLAQARATLPSAELATATVSANLSRAGREMNMEDVPAATARSQAALFGSNAARAAELAVDIEEKTAETNELDGPDGP